MEVGLNIMETLSIVEFAPVKAHLCGYASCYKKDHHKSVKDREPRVRFTLPGQFSSVQATITKFNTKRAKLLLIILNYCNSFAFYKCVMNLASFDAKFIS